MQLHPLCLLFPAMSPAELRALTDDVRANGLREPITRYDGQILDGQHRYAACIDAGVEPRFVDFDGSPADVVALVLSKNLHRRHLDAGQRAAAVAGAQDWATAHPAHRVAKEGCNVAPFSQPEAETKKGATLHPSRVQDRAATAGVSPRTQKMADKVAKAAPELVRRVAQGEVSLPAAVRQVEGKPAPEPKPKAPPPAPSSELERLRADNEELRALNAELAAQCKELLAENEALAKVVDADDRIGEALRVAREAREREEALQSRLNGLMNERNANVRHIKALQRQLEARV